MNTPGGGSIVITRAGRALGTGVGERARLVLLLVAGSAGRRLG